LKEIRKTVTVGLEIPNEPFDPSDLLQELKLLLSNLGIEVVGRFIQRRKTIDPATLIGKGKAHEAALLCKTLGADLLVTDEALSPVQMANLRNILGIEVWDRPYVIMKIFEARAYTSEAKLQVELAKCRYEIPHLKGLGLQMSRAGGGIGTRGPGETEFERHRRKLERKVKYITAKLEHVKQMRKIQRKRRNKAGLMTFSLAGYTNSGKSTLLGALAYDKGIVAKDQLFCTLDTFVRQMVLPGGAKILLADTVGFIRKLPPELVAAFRTTLEEIILSDMVLIVLDAGSDKVTEHFDVIQDYLGSFGASGIPRLVILNKIDMIDESERDFMVSRFKNIGEKVVATSAVTGLGLKRLKDVLEKETSILKDMKRSESYAS